MVEFGEVYYDDVFGEEVYVYAVGDENVFLKWERNKEPREYKRELWNHNISIGRFEKTEETFFHEEKKEDGLDETGKGIFDY